MNDLRKAAEMALEALEWINRVNAMDYEYQQKAREPIQALRQALAQDALRELAEIDHELGLFIDDGPAVKKWVPLTDEQIFEHEWWDEETAFAVNKELKEKNG